MKVQIESTAKIVTLTSGEPIQARIWEGVTESGIPVHLYVTRVAVANDQDHTEFERELLEQRAPSADVAALPPRLTL